MKSKYQKVMTTEEDAALPLQARSDQSEPADVEANEASIVAADPATDPAADPAPETKPEPTPEVPPTLCFSCSRTVTFLKTTFWEYLKADVRYLLFTLFIVLLIGTVSFLFKVDKFKVQAFRSFDIEDPTINYTHNKSTISGTLNIIITTAYAVIVSLLGNLCTSLGCKRMNCKRACCNSRIPASVDKVQIQPASKLYKVTDTSQGVDRLRMYRLIWSLLFLLLALAENNMLTNFTKTMMGTLKPHFLKECQPDYTVLHGTTWVNETLTKVICINKDNYDYRRAFPSGHASQASVCVVYAFLEIHCIPNVIAARFIQLGGLLYWIIVCSLRITKNHHHWYEVMGGAILGAVIALSSYPMKEIQIRRQFKTANQKIYEKCMVGPSDACTSNVQDNSKHKEQHISAV